MGLGLFRRTSLPAIRVGVRDRRARRRRGREGTRYLEKRGTRFVEITKMGGGIVPFPSLNSDGPAMFLGLLHLIIDVAT